MRIVVPSTEEERVRLIGELLCKGILSSPSLRGGIGSTFVAADSGAGSPDDRIIEYLRRHHAASPVEMRAVLNLSRTSTYRALQRLLLSGQIVSNGGRTSAAAYRLVDPSRN